MVRKATNPESVNDALVVAMKSLQRAAQTKAQINDKLARRAYTNEVIDVVLNKLEAMYLIDDEKYAKDYISYRSRTTPLGSRYLKLKLAQKGVPKEVAEAAVKEISPDDELVLARVAAAKRQRTMGRFNPEQRKLKLARFLASRGFRSDVIYKLIKEI